MPFTVHTNKICNMTHVKSDLDSSSSSKKKKVFKKKTIFFANSIFLMLSLPVNVNFSVCFINPSEFYSPLRQI